MNSVGRLSKMVGFCVAIAACLVISAEAAVNKAVVRRVIGSATVSSDRGASWKPLRVGASVSPNSTIRTAAESTVDLFLNQNGPVVRVTGETTLGIDKLDYDSTGIETVIETQLDLRSGRVLGNVKKMAAASKYEVKTPMGVAGIRGTEYDISANGAVHVISGTVVVVYVVGNQISTVTVPEGKTSYPPTTPGGQPRLEDAPNYVPPVWEPPSVTTPVESPVVIIPINPDYSNVPSTTTAPAPGGGGENTGGE